MGNPHSRRSVLAGAGALALAAFVPGCTGGGDPTPTPSATPAPPPDPLLALLEVRIALAMAYDAVATRHPNLSGRLLPVRDQTQEQVTVLRRALALPAPAPTTTAAST
nr:twin-arginine translocation signal domain-containing protein [Geodermatophilaceae bacterium]